MGEASMRKWLRRAVLEIRHPRPGVASESEVRAEALHMRLRERRRREFWRCPFVKILPPDDAEVVGD